ncbi:MAG: alkaline phosphatase family protein [bacterium]
MIIRKLYNERIESFATRLLYFMNTIDTYYLVAGILSFLFLSQGKINFMFFIVLLGAAYLCFKISDFYPVYLFFTPLYLFFFCKLASFHSLIALKILGINIAIFALIQILFMGIPDAIIARDVTIPVRKIYKSLFTIAPTTVSFLMSVYFSTLLSFVLYFRPNPFVNPWGLGLWVSLLGAAFITRKLRPKSFVSQDFKPVIEKGRTERVILLNIDGCRLDRFYEAKLPFLTSLEKESSYFSKGLQTVYRALTNPAFASILTGTTPDIHGVMDNNLGRRIRVEGLPDLVKTILYGSMHVRHFSKTHWQTKVVSLPVHSIYRTDEVMFDWLKADLLSENETRLFIADLSEVDFLGHAYGSESHQYLEALKKADRRIEAFFGWLNNNNLLKDTVVIICSDHGIVRIDHSYLIFQAEKFVPFIITGEGIKKYNPLDFEASIMDIAPTISYLLGIKYPDSCKGRVFMEAIVQ